MDDINNFDSNPQDPNQQQTTIQPISTDGSQSYEPQINMVQVDIKSLTGWATFRAVMDIISGAFACLSIIGAAYGVPLILSAIKLLNYVDEVKKDIRNNDKQKLSNAMEYLQKYFKLNGISTIVRICFIVLSIIIWMIALAFLISSGYMDRSIDLQAF